MATQVQASAKALGVQAFIRGPVTPTITRPIVPLFVAFPTPNLTLVEAVQH